MKNKLLAVFLFLSLSALAACTPAAIGTPSPLPATLTPSTTPSSPSPSPTLSPSTTGTPTPILSSTPSPIPQVTLEAVGDLMLARTVGEQILANGPQVIFAGVQSAFDPADVLVGNLECVITDSDASVQKSFDMKAPPESAKALSLAGFDLVSLANNHAMDFGYPGLLDSQKYLSQYGTLTVGAGANATAAHTPVIIRRNGLRLAFLAYVDVPPEKSGFDAHIWTATATAPGIAWAEPDQIQTDVRAAKLQADLVIVLLHGGIEITDVINPISTNQRTEAHAAIDAGASLVIGAHPHVLESLELYHGGLIAYSLGNFVFDQYLGIANASVILRVVLTPAGVKSYDYVPVLIENGLPQIITDQQVPAIATRIAPINP